MSANGSITLLPPIRPSGGDAWAYRVPGAALTAGTTYILRLSADGEESVTRTFVWEDTDTTRVRITSPLEGAAFTSSIVTLQGAILGSGLSTPPATATVVAVYADAETTALESFTIPANTATWSEEVDVGSRSGSILLRLVPAGAQAAQTSVRVGVETYSPGSNQIEYAASSDGEILSGYVWWPDNASLTFDGFSNDPVPLVLWLHGAQASGEALVRSLSTAISTRSTRRARRPSPSRGSVLRRTAGCSCRWG